MKAITLTQPWATLVAKGEKKFETRSWRTDYRGLLYIHSAKQFPIEARRLCFRHPFYNVLNDKLGIEYSSTFGFFLPLGKIIAIVELVDIIPTEKIKLGKEISYQEWKFGDYSIGRFVWKLKLIQELDPRIPAKGALRIWEFNDGQFTE